MTDTDTKPETTPWFNTDAGRTKIGATILAAFRIIGATVVFAGPFHDRGSTVHDSAGALA